MLWKSDTVKNESKKFPRAEIVNLTPLASSHFVFILRLFITNIMFSPKSTALKVLIHYCPSAINMFHRRPVYFLPATVILPILTNTCWIHTPLCNEKHRYSSTQKVLGCTNLSASRLTRSSKQNRVYFCNNRLLIMK